jgi:hypothetical protein
MTKNNGGPAFPTVAGQTVYSNGMSLRDWFAGQALAGICAYSGEGSKLIDTNPKAIAKTAYIWADAMIAARGAE